MGNTGISSAHDNETIFYNPASLANVQRSYLDILAVQLATPLSVSDLQDSYSAINQGEPDAVNNFINNAPESGTIGFSGMISFNHQAIDRGWNIAGTFLSEFRQDYVIVNDDPLEDKEAIYQTRLDNVIALAISYPFNLGEYVIGATVKRVQRRLYDYSYSVIEAAEKREVPKSEDYDEGTANGFDLGFLYRKPG